MASALHCIIVCFLLACSFPVLAQEPWILDTTFTPAFGQIEASPSGARTGDVLDFGFQSDGKIIVAGRFTLVEGRPVKNIARLNRDGSLDTNFTASVNDVVHGMILDRQDRIIIGGRSVVDGVSFPYLIRLLPNGERDQTFNPVLEDRTFPEGLLLQDDGKILLYGSLENPDRPQTSTPILRFNNDGTLDRTFQQVFHWGIIQEPRGAALQPDGKIVLGGSCDFEPNTGFDYDLVRLNGDGTLDPTFLMSTNLDFIEDIEIQADGKILVMNLAAIVRFQSSGEPDPSFTPFSPHFGGHAIFALPDGNVAYSISSYLGLVSSSGSLIGEMELQPSPTRFTPYTFHIGPDGHLWMSGFCNYGTTNYGLLRLLPFPLSVYSEWRQKYTVIAGAERMGALDSVLQDGIPNFVKYALGLSAMQNMQLFEAPLRMTADGKLHLRYNKAATDVIIRLEKSSALSGAPWSSFASWNGEPSSWVVDDSLSAQMDPTEVVISGFVPAGTTQFVRATFEYDR